MTTTQGLKALIVVDVQNDFITGSLAVTDAEATAARIATLLGSEDAAKAYDIVVFTQDWHINPGDHFSDTPDFKDAWPVHARANTWGADLHKDVAAAARGFKGRTATFHKGMYSAAYSGFEGEENEYGGKLAKWLRAFEVTDLDIVGIATDYCVKATAIDAVREGFTTSVLIPFTATVTPEGAVAARQEMTEAGVRVEEVAA